MSRTAAPPAHVPIRTALLRWYRRAKRDLPWRRTTDPYRVWLSEIMLQQTQVATVIPYYERFLSRFPAVADLAAAPLEDVLRLWSGLGYYARARNLHAAARHVAMELGGRFPDTVAGLRELPGVGRYTAGAIASICFGRRAPIVDGNVARVWARVFAIRAPIKSPAAQARLWKLSEELLPRRECGDFNQSVMELGATVCTPAAPHCDRCPLSKVCRARAVGLVDRLPTVERRAAVKRLRLAVLAIMRDEHVLMETRDGERLWGGLWHLPSAEMLTRETSAAAAGRIAAGLTGVAAGSRVVVAPRVLTTMRWKLTHRDVTFAVHRGSIRIGAAKQRPRTTSGAPARNGATRWVHVSELADAPLSTAMRRLIEESAVLEQSAASNSAL